MGNRHTRPVSLHFLSRAFGCRISSSTSCYDYVHMILSSQSFLNLGSPERGLVTPDPTLDTTLPIDDASFDAAVRLLALMRVVVFRSLTGL